MGYEYNTDGETKNVQNILIRKSLEKQTIDDLKDAGEYHEDGSQGSRS
jgi:hypothetical protein